LKTLITGGKSAQALKLLKAFTGDQILLGDYGDMPSLSAAQYQFVSLGELNLDTIAHTLLNSCLDLSVDRLVPLRDFELEAVMKSAVLFEEFSIHILLPAMDDFPLYAQTGALNKQQWAVYDQGKLVYASVDNLDLVNAGPTLNGVYYMDETAEGFNPILFSIA
jgi:hypothetical protein